MLWAAIEAVAERVESRNSEDMGKIRTSTDSARYLLWRGARNTEFDQWRPAACAAHLELHFKLSRSSIDPKFVELRQKFEIFDVATYTRSRMRTQREFRKTRIIIICSVDRATK